MTEKLWNKKKAGSVRSLRVAHEIKQIISEILWKEKPYEDGVGEFSVTVTDVVVSSSLQDVTIYVVPIDKTLTDTIMDYLKRRSSQFKTMIGRRLGLKFTPNIRFNIDNSFDYADHIDRLLEQINDKARLTK